MGSSGGGGGPSSKEIRSRERELDKQRRAQVAREKRYEKMLSGFHAPAIALPAPPPVPEINIPKPPKPIPPPTENKQEVAEAQDQASRDARRRRGLQSTILAGETGRPSLKSNTTGGTKTTLG